MFPLVRDPGDARAMGRAIPSNVKDLIRRRVARLPMETGQALSASAVLGHDFELTLLADLLEVDPGSLLEPLEPALHAGVLIDSPAGVGRFRCSHGLVHEVLYDDLGVAQRARMHSRAATTLADRATASTEGPHLITIADHWFKAVPAAPPEQGRRPPPSPLRTGARPTSPTARPRRCCSARSSCSGRCPQVSDRARSELEVQNELCLLYIVTTSYAGERLAGRLGPHPRAVRASSATSSCSCRPCGGCRSTT